MRDIIVYIYKSKDKQNTISIYKSKDKHNSISTEQIQYIPLIYYLQFTLSA